jgi:hypothetical protein
MYVVKTYQQRKFPPAAFRKGPLMSYDDSVMLLWSLTDQGLSTGTTISATGNSGGYNALTPNACSAVDLRHADDYWLSVIAAAGVGTNLKVQLNLFDAQGNLFQYITGTTPLLGVTVASAPGQAIAFAGRHGGGGSGNYIVPSSWGQIAWTIATGSMTGVEINLYGR